jgi:hypothetical protein
MKEEQDLKRWRVISSLVALILYILDRIRPLIWTASMNSVSFASIKTFRLDSQLDPARPVIINQPVPTNSLHGFALALLGLFLFRKLVSAPVALYRGTYRVPKPWRCHGEHDGGFVGTWGQFRSARGISKSWAS